MTDKRFIIGSRAFFEGMPDFKPKDRDTLAIVDKGNGFQYLRQVSMHGSCRFTLVRLPKEELIRRTNDSKTAMAVGKFLVPEVCEELGFTLDDVKQMLPAIEKLDDAHKYERVIYEAYVANGEMCLTDEQRQAAYSEYKAARKDKKGDKAKGARNPNEEAPL